MARILVAGCGDIGAATGRSLAADGHDVVGLKRQPPDINDSITYVQADLSRASDLKALGADFDLIVYILSPDGRSEEAYRRVFEHGVNNLLGVLTSIASPARIIFVSSTSVYGQRLGEWVDEESATEPAGMNGRVLLQAEKAVLAHGNNNCIVRFAGIYGRGRSWLLRDVAKGGNVQHTPPYYTNRIHRDDCVAVLSLLSTKLLAGDRLEPVYLASDDDPAPKWEVYNFLAEQLGLAPPGKAILPTGTDQNKRCQNTRLKRLGYQLIYKSYREGYATPGPEDA